MSYFFYPDTPSIQKFNHPIDYTKMKANDRYIEHFHNMMILCAIVNKPKSLIEKRQAEKEIVKCQKKLDWWSKHMNFDQAEVARQVKEIKDLWNTSNNQQIVNMIINS